MSPDWRQLFERKKPLIGMIHLLPLPGYAGSPGMTALIDKALKDLATLERAGFDGVLVENEYDQPHNVEAKPETLAAMTAITAAVVRESSRLVVGVEILLHDPPASLAAAHAAGASFIRTDYFVDRMSRPEYGGEMRLDPKGWLAYRERIGAGRIGVFADLQVKYAILLEEGKTLAESALQAAREGADALIVSGKVSGDAPVVSHIEEARDAGADRRVLIGSGLTPENAEMLLAAAQGAIVGTGIITDRAVDYDKAARLAEVRARLEAR